VKRVIITPAFLACACETVTPTDQAHRIVSNGDEEISICVDWEQDPPGLFEDDCETPICEWARRPQGQG